MTRPQYSSLRLHCTGHSFIHQFIITTKTMDTLSSDLPVDKVGLLWRSSNKREQTVDKKSGMRIAETAHVSITGNFNSCEGRAWV